MTRSASYFRRVKWVEPRPDEAVGPRAISEKVMFKSVLEEVLHSTYKTLGNYLDTQFLG